MISGLLKVCPKNGLEHFCLKRLEFLSLHIGALHACPLFCLAYAESFSSIFRMRVQRFFALEEWPEIMISYRESKSHVLHCFTNQMAEFNYIATTGLVNLNFWWCNCITACRSKHFTIFLKDTVCLYTFLSLNEICVLILPVMRAKKCSVYSVLEMTATSSPAGIVPLKCRQCRILQCRETYLRGSIQI